MRSTRNAWLRLKRQRHHDASATFFKIFSCMFYTKSSVFVTLFGNNPRMSTPKSRTNIPFREIVD